jgi:DNA-binding transcriptional LysR family regulator
MDRDLLGHLPVIVCVARRRAFAAAAMELGMSPSAVSHAVRIVEDRLGAPLFARTTRSVSVTEAGARFIAGIEPELADIDKAFEGMTAERGQVTGLLRIHTPRGVLDTLLIPVLARLASEHPRLIVEIRTGAFPGDIVAQGCDAGVSLRRFIQQDMVTTRVGEPVNLILVASPDYLGVRGAPKSILDLHQHNCIGMRNIASGALLDWELIDGNRQIAVKPSGTVLVTEMTEALSLALAGIGIAYVVESLADPHLRVGSLKRLLPETAVEQDGAFLYYPRRASLAPKLSAFIQVAKKALRSRQ